MYAVQRLAADWHTPASWLLMQLAVVLQQGLGGEWLGAETAGKNSPALTVCFFDVLAQVGSKGECFPALPAGVDRSSGGRGQNCRMGGGGGADVLRGFCVVLIWSDGVLWVSFV